jgi:hypothetical protein
MEFSWMETEAGIHRVIEIPYYFNKGYEFSKQLSLPSDIKEAPFALKKGPDQKT